MKKKYEVGYKKPPKATQFGGENANPWNKDGRPKRKEIARLSEEALWSIVTDSANQPVNMTERGETVIVPLLEAIVKGIANDAARGDRFARREYIKLLEKATQYKDGLHVEMHMIWADLREKKLRLMNDVGSLEHVTFMYDYFMSKKHLRAIEGADSWIFEDGEPITDEDWGILISHVEMLKKSPETNIAWPPKYPSSDPDG